MTSEDAIAIPHRPQIEAGDDVLNAVSDVGTVGGYDLTLSTTIAGLGLDVKTTVLGHLTTDTAVSRLVRAPGIAQCQTALHPPGGLATFGSRCTLLLEHYTAVQDAVCRLTGKCDVRIELPQDLSALGLLGERAARGGPGLAG
jgi:hypothetical protein